MVVQDVDHPGTTTVGKADWVPSICHRSSGAWFKAPPRQHNVLLLPWWYRCIALYTKMNRDTAGTTAGMTTAMTASSSWQCGQRATPLDLGEPIKRTCERWRKHATGICGNVERVSVEVNPMPLSGALVTRAEEVTRIEQACPSLSSDLP